MDISELSLWRNSVPYKFSFLPQKVHLWKAENRDPEKLIEPYMTSLRRDWRTAAITMEFVRQSRRDVVH